MKKILIFIMAILVLCMPLETSAATTDKLYYDIWGVRRELKPFRATAYEKTLLEKIVMAEAEGEPFVGKIAVTNIILNRVRSASFPNTVRAVIYQKNQFSPIKDGRFVKAKPTFEVKKAVEVALSGVAAIPEYVYFFMNSRTAKSSWISTHRQYIITIGKHDFYK